MIDIDARMCRPRFSRPQIVWVLDEPIAGNDHWMDPQHLGDEVALEEALTVLAECFKWDAKLPSRTVAYSYRRRSAEGTAAAHPSSPVLRKAVKPSASESGVMAPFEPVNNMTHKH